MLSEPTIRRCFEQRDHERMLKAVAANGTPMPLPLRARLGSDSAAGIALGLRRLVELTYGPTALSRKMTHTLLTLQRDDGGWGDGGVACDGRGLFNPTRADPLVTACVLAALSRVDSQQPAARDPQLTKAIERGLRALSDLQRDDALFDAGDDRDEDARLLTAAFVLFLLAGHPGFRGAIRFADLMNRLDDKGDRLDRAAEELLVIARLEDRPLPGPLLAA